MKEKHPMEPDIWRWLVVYFSLTKKQRRHPAALRAALKDYEFAKLPRIPAVITHSPSIQAQAMALRQLHQQLFSNLKNDGTSRRAEPNRYSSQVLLADYEETLTPLMPRPRSQAIPAHGAAPIQTIMPRERCA